MRHFSTFPPPLPRSRAHRGRSLAIAAALACGIVPGDPRAAAAGTVIRGRVMLPETATIRSADGARKREALDARDAVVYVTVPAGGDGRALAGRARGREIEVERDHFRPRVLPVVAGSVVRFRNRDEVFHSVFSVSAAGRSDLGDLAPGAKRERRFEQAGVVNLFCGLHPAAAGFVVVCPNWFYTRPDAAGAYALPALPRGRYLVHAWHPRGGQTRRAVEVTGRGTLALDLGL